MDNQFANDLAQMDEKFWKLHLKPESPSPPYGIDYWIIPADPVPDLVVEVKLP